MTTPRARRLALVIPASRNHRVNVEHALVMRPPAARR